MACDVVSSGVLITTTIWAVLERLLTARVQSGFAALDMLTASTDVAKSLMASWAFIWPPIVTNLTMLLEKTVCAETSFARCSPISQEILALLS